MSFLVSDVYAALPNYLSGRTITQYQACENIRKTVLELTESYPTPLLQVSGPLTQLTLNLAGPYSPATFLQPVDAGLEVNELSSFFLYYNGAPVAGQQNAGFNLIYKDISNLEILLNTPGLTTNWTRHEGQLYFAMAPIQAYYLYLRYQKEHPFPNAGNK